MYWDSQVCEGDRDTACSYQVHPEKNSFETFKNKDQTLSKSA